MTSHGTNILKSALLRNFDFFLCLFSFYQLYTDTLMGKRVAKPSLLMFLVLIKIVNFTVFLEKETLQVRVPIILQGSKMNVKEGSGNV
jgi:hypothetical protein